MIELAPNEVQLWFYEPPVSGESLSHLNLAALSPSELKKFESIKATSKKIEYFYSRKLLQKVLSCYLGEHCEEVEYCYNFYGKPYIDLPKEGRRFRFNLTHCVGLMIVAVTLEQAVGVDVEDMQREISEELVGQYRHKSQSIITEYNGIPLIYQWVLKEALSKSVGLGLSLSFRDFEFVQIGQRLKVNTRSAHLLSRTWSCSLYQYKKSYAVAVISAQDESMGDEKKVGMQAQAYLVESLDEMSLAEINLAPVWESESPL